MRDQVTSYVQLCHSCQKNKRKHKPYLVKRERVASEDVKIGKDQLTETTRPKRLVEVHQLLIFIFIWQNI